MKYGSLFTGIAGFDRGFDQVGMECAWQVEIDKKCIEILERHYPNVRRYEDVRFVGKNNLESVDLICGGFPCQDLSIAGKRKGISGERSGLWFEFERIIGELKPRWVVIENVPGLLSSNKGRDFAIILQALAEFGYGVCWRILDAQYFGLAQRRKRLFIVGSLGNGRSAEVLYECESGDGGTAPSREEKKNTPNNAPTSPLRGFGHGWQGQHNDTNPVIAMSSDLAQITSKVHGSRPSEISQPLNTLGRMIAWHNKQQSGEIRIQGDTAPTMSRSWGTGGNNVPFVGVRRLTPVECERLQGFPDGWTAGQSDSVRYRQLGNAVAVPVIEWIGKRIIESEARS